MAKKMNPQRKAAALKKYKTAAKTATREEVSDLLKADEKKYNDAELAEILADLFPGVAQQQQQNPNTGTQASDPGKDQSLQASTPPKKAKATGTGANPSLAEFLADIDYTQLNKKKNFMHYVEKVGDRAVEILDDDSGKTTPLRGQLMDNEEYVFEQYRATPVMKDRFPGIENTPKDYVGLTINNTTPIHTTKMSIKVALELNSQILNQHSRAGHGKYYLLKK